MALNQRRVKILHLIREDGHAKVQDLSKIFNVTDVTIRQDLEAGSVYLLLNEKQLALGTVTLKNHEIYRLFVLPAHQKKGYGRRLMDFAEQKIFECTDICRLDASLPAKAIYIKRGYRESAYHIIPTENGDFLCYDVMQKTKNTDK